MQCTSLFHDFVLKVGVVDHLGHCQLGDQKLKAYLEHHIVQFEECYAKISVGILLMYFICSFSEDYILNISYLPRVFLVYTVHMYRIHMFMPAHKLRIKFNRKYFVDIYFRII